MPAMRLWKPSPRTGRYPPLRIVWNILWALPLLVSLCLFVVCVFCALGPDEALNRWRNNA